MGTNVTAFCNHNYPAQRGSDILAEFEKRFQCKCHWITKTSENPHLSGIWELGVYDYGTPDNEWEKANHLEFIWPADNSLDEQEVDFWGSSLVELGDNNWSDWLFFSEAFIALTAPEDYKDDWKKYRRNIYELMKKVGGDKVIFGGDTCTEILLFGLVKEGAMERDEPDEYPTFDQMLELARQKGIRIFYHPVTADQLTGIEIDTNFIYNSILIDDFQDLIAQDNYRQPL